MGTSWNYGPAVIARLAEGSLWLEHGRHGQHKTLEIKLKPLLCQPARAWPGAGGAIALNNASSVVVTSSTFTENVSENGGAIFVQDCGAATIADNTFTSNRANKSGGAVFQSKCSGKRSALLR